MKREERSVMKYERNVITMTFHLHSSQICSLDNCVDDTFTETDLKIMNYPP